MFRGTIAFDMNSRFPELVFEQRQRFTDDLMNIDLGKACGGGARKIQKVIDDLGSAECLPGDLLKKLETRIFGTYFLSQHLRITGNDGQWGVYFVRNARSQQTDRRKFLVLNQLVFKPDAF